MEPRTFEDDTIEKQHSEWQEACLEQGASNGQKHDLKIAFYAGAAAVFRIMLKVNEVDDIPDDLASTKLNSLVDEVSQFLGFTATTTQGPPQ